MMRIFKTLRCILIKYGFFVVSNSRKNFWHPSCINWSFSSKLCQQNSATGSSFLFIAYNIFLRVNLVVGYPLCPNNVIISWSYDQITCIIIQIHILHVKAYLTFSYSIRKVSQGTFFMVLGHLQLLI